MTVKHKDKKEKEKEKKVQDVCTIFTIDMIIRG